MDVMGIALDYAMHDIRELVGMHSDNEEYAEDDEDYGNMNSIVNQYNKRKRADSDSTNNGASEGGSYFRGGRPAGADAYHVSIL